MKRLVSLFFLILPALITNSCLFNSDNCVTCDIYDNYGTYMEFYGTECGPDRKNNNYIDEAEQYAVDYYEGYAICYEE